MLIINDDFENGKYPRMPEEELRLLPKADKDEFEAQSRIPLFLNPDYTRLGSDADFILFNARNTRRGAKESATSLPGPDSMYIPPRKKTEK